MPMEELLSSVRRVEITTTMLFSLITYHGLWCFLMKQGFGELLDCMRSLLWSIIGYALLMIPSLIYSVYFGGFLVQFLIEKMGMMGSLPQSRDLLYVVFMLFKDFESPTVRAEKWKHDMFDEANRSPTPKMKMIKLPRLKRY
ncbi:hypothetical protein Sjap_015566 [Stephania japonica]|uniref:Transmembrane protein n=1 Tax=Stephania japonica TaxID=461633 RepID=A0AAP0NSM4_9MAGN